jgi:hypothetical protein
VIHLVQCLCPKRHCIFAIAFVHPEVTDEEATKIAKAQWQEGVESGGLNPWCALCNSQDMRFEVGQTRFGTMAEAMPHLEEMQREQIATRARLLRERN